MKKFFKLYSIMASGLMLLGLASCEPAEIDKPDSGSVTPPSSVTFSAVVNPTNASRYTLTNTTPIAGVYQANWDLGNGSTATGNSAMGYYPLPGSYKVVLKITTNLGTTISDTTVITTTVTDEAYLNNPMNILLSGGIDDLDGKTWMVDSARLGHFGVGGSSANPTEWWNATPNQKSECGTYDDDIVLKFSGFKAQLLNHGDSYVQGKFLDQPYFTNPVKVKDDYKVNFTPATDYTWSYDPDTKVLSFAGSLPMVIGVYTGCVDNKYTIMSYDDHHLQMAYKGSDGNWWALCLIEKGFILPAVTYTSVLEPTAVTNEYAASIKNIVLPVGSSLDIDNYTVDFGDGTPLMTAGSSSDVLKHVYMRKGVYTATQSVILTDGKIEKHPFTVTIAANHPDYVPFDPGMMVMYADNSEVLMFPVLGENCTVASEASPLVQYPNKGQKAFHYKKENNDYANAYMKLNGYRFDLRTNSTFKMWVYGKKDQVVLLKLENTDRAEAWKTGAEKTYTIKADNTWEVAEYKFAGVSAGWSWTGDIYTTDVTTDPNFNHDFFNIVRIMLNPGNKVGVHEFYFDDLQGPSVEGIKSLQVK